MQLNCKIPGVYTAIRTNSTTKNLYESAFRRFHGTPETVQALEGKSVQVFYLIRSRFRILIRVVQVKNSSVKKLVQASVNGVYSFLSESATVVEL